MSGSCFIMARNVDVATQRTSAAFPTGSGGDLELSAVCLNGVGQVTLQCSCDLVNWFDTTVWNPVKAGNNVFAVSGVAAGYIRLTFQVVTGAPILLSVRANVKEQGDCACQ